MKTTVFLTAALVAAFFVTTPASAACVTPAQMSEYVLAKTPEVEATMVIDEATARAVVTAYNLLPPWSNFVADRIVTYRLPEYPIFLIGMFNIGCRVAQFYMPVRIFRSLTGIEEGIKT